MNQKIKKLIKRSQKNKRVVKQPEFVRYRTIKQFLDANLTEFAPSKDHYMFYENMTTEEERAVFFYNFIKGNQTIKNLDLSYPLWITDQVVFQIVKAIKETPLTKITKITCYETVVTSDGISAIIDLIKERPQIKFVFENFGPEDKFFEQKMKELHSN